MALTRRVAMAAVGLGAVGLGILLAAPREEKFHTRLAPVPISIAMRATIAGTGTATAELAGSKVSINGTFEGLKSPATAAQLHLSRVAGIRGPAVFDLTVSRATSGTVTGSFDLNADQVEEFRKGRFYIQIDSEKAPDGNLWGWLMH
jgi:CHRD domain